MKRWFWLLLCAVAWGRDLRQDLENAYREAELCARLKFVDGMLGHRAAGFQLFGPDGLSRDLTLERDRFQVLFSRATRVRFRVQLLKIVPTKGGAHVDANESLVVEQVEPQTRELYTIVLNSRVIDTWEYRAGEIRLVASSVQNQTSQRAGPLREP
ncbi:MAG: hypothetical protein U0931_42445 [Vulcanimicrobiota bacterium]